MFDGSLGHTAGVTTPASQRDPRLDRLREPHVAPLTDYVLRLRAKHGGGEAVPWFDPDDGGINARVLLLLEAPGPRALGTDSPRPASRGSGFISATNNDPTARITLACRTEAGLTADQCVHWNAVPWYIGDGTRIRPATTADLVAALPATRELLGLLPDLRVVVLLGNKAQDAWPRLTTRYPSTVRISVLPCPHPAPRSTNRPGARDHIVTTLRQANDLARA